MEQSPSCGSNTSSVCQEILRFLWSPEVHYTFYNSPPPVSILYQLNQVHATPFHFFKIQFYITFPPSLSLPSCLLLSGISTKA